MSQTLVNILKQVEQLSEPERRQLAAFLAEGNGASEAELGLESKLVAEGWLSLPVPRSPGDSSAELAPPLSVSGRPCSEMLVQERR